MSTLLQQRCYHHTAREAVARCPECRLYFCRECVVEHELRVLCAACLRKAGVPAPAKSQWCRLLWQVAAAAAGFVLLWFIFYMVGQMLLAIPSQFHEGTLWQNALLGRP
ncbi:MAG: rhomboid family protein [Verrucomicrobiae bacterium]|nr:rhomboid family protein [Verrucomicrobiae bacterium]